MNIPSSLWVKTFPLIPKIFRGARWKIDTSEKVLYLTFDDGPTPKVTHWVLEELEKRQAKATFFCLGKNVQAHPTIFNEIKEQGHSIGNHTFSHQNGWETSLKDYLNDAAEADKYLNSKLFRPPYGKMTWRQYKALQQQYTLILWDVIAGDFLEEATGEWCFNNIKKHATAGSIVVLHDSEKCFETLKVCLPLIMDHFEERGYGFERLDG